eukprot:m51a1_g7623 hypothetical protein (1212) ;mRNA; f:299922-304422
MAENVVSGLMNMPNTRRQLGYPAAGGADAVYAESNRLKSVALVLASLGVESPPSDNADLAAVAHDLILNYREKVRLLSGALPPVAQRVQTWVNTHLADVLTDGPVRFPWETINLPQHGIARALSFPPGEDMFVGGLQTSYRLRVGDQGVLHNPRSDKRTTQGSFHIAEGGMAIPADKYRVPKAVFARMLKIALNPPDDVNTIPYTTKLAKPRALMASLLLRPLVCPEVPGKYPARSMEVYCMAPGSLVSCLDFLESVFGNAGDPYLPENDSALDVERWTGHSGCLILAPHLCKVAKKDLGLPNVSEATALQKEQGMCWTDPAEPYNGGRAFKVTCRTAEGVIVTIIADNYFGYMKKEVKTQISYATNLLGVAEEEHSGGTLAFPRYSFGMALDNRNEETRWPHLAGYKFAEAMQLLGGAAQAMPGGYAVDRNFPSIVYVPETARFSLVDNTVEWGDADGANSGSLKLRPSYTYVLPSGFKVRVEHHAAAPAFRLIGTEGRGVFMHKPCTVSGGGKSELSKSIAPSIMYGPLFVNDPERDFEMVAQILTYPHYDKRFLGRKATPASPEPDECSSDEEVDAMTPRSATRPILSMKRSLGSVIKLTTPSAAYNDEYNAWLRSFPAHVWPIVYYVKRFYKPEWGDNWRQHFSMDQVNGAPGHELKFNDRKIMAGFLRVGYTPETGGWRTFKTRIDFMPSTKVQMEDDISVSATVPVGWLPHAEDDRDEDLESGRRAKRSLEKPVARKLVVNCEFRLFQRPDDCVHPGLDPQCEWDLAQPGNFIANFEPHHPDFAKALAEDVCSFEDFSKPMRDFLTSAAGLPEAEAQRWLVSSAHTRIVNGKPTANPRYLQVRPDAVDAQSTYVAQVGMRLAKRIPAGVPVVYTVDVTLLGRRISPPAPGLPNLAVYNPMHYQELPELIADVISSLSGTSPSTTGAGSEGAMTKGPFNAMPFAADINAMLVSSALTLLGGWSTPTGRVGPKCNFGHDVSFLTPEVWCRMKPHERDARWLAAHGYLERVRDFDHNGQKVLASRLGWRITEKFAHFFGRVLDFPATLFGPEVLRPELQSLDAFADGVNTVVESQRNVAAKYFADGTVELLVPPLQALLRIMAGKALPGESLDDPKLRQQFTREGVLSSAWYRRRLETQRDRDQALWARHVSSLESYMADQRNAGPVERLGLAQRLEAARAHLAHTRDPKYIDELVGSLGADPFAPQA